MSNVTKLKEAIKTALAFALVFGIAMRLDWMSPSWAGWAVAVVALPTAGESIQKGLLRVVGTIPGCLAALIIQALAPQERWTFILLTCGWVFFTVYLMVSRPKYSYVWTMACYVCLIIVLSDPDSSANMFQSAVFREVETVMGVTVYTLIAVFLWPRTNLGAIKESSVELAASLNDIYRADRDTLLGRPDSEAHFLEIQGKVVQQLTRFGKVLRAEGSESYEVHEVRRFWERFHELSSAFLETADRLRSCSPELDRIDMRTVFPEIPAFFAELDVGFAVMTQVLAGRATGHQPRTIRLEVDSAAFQRLTHFDRAAVAVAKMELENLEGLTAELLACTLEATGQTEIGINKTEPVPAAALRSRAPRLPVPDWDHLRIAAFVAATTGVGFLIWIFFNPPGHALWFQVSGTIALMVALAPNIRASKLIMPVAVTSAVCLAIYVFIMPQLSSFLGLGSLLFVTMFLTAYFFTGLARFFCSMAILNMLVIQNHQVYSFAAMANIFVFFVMVFAFLFMMSYLLSSPRPEKVVLDLLDRFFRSAEFLMSRRASGLGRVSCLDRWRIAFHERQLRSIPAKLGVWGMSIDSELFPDTTPEQIQSLATGTQELVYRLDQLIEAGEASQAEALAGGLRGDVTSWHTALGDMFGQWARNPEAEPVAELRQRLEAAVHRLEEQVEAVVNRPGRAVSKEEGENFLRLLGGYRGVSEAAVVYAGAAGHINFDQWREERFS